MKSGNRIIKQLKQIVKPRDAIFRQKLYVFLVCLFISVFIWFLIMLSNESVTSIKYDIDFTNLPPGMVLTNQPDSVLTFRIASGGFDLFVTKYLKRKFPIEIDLSDMALEKKSSQFMGVFPTSQLSELIFQRFDFSEELLSISPENLFFQFEPLNSKWVPVIPHFTFAFEPPFRQSDSLQIEPDSARIAGPKEDIDKIDSVFAVRDPVKGINKAITLNCKLELPRKISNIEIIPQQVTIAIPTDKFTESSLEIPITLQDIDQEVKIFPATVKITFLVSLTDFPRIDPTQFEVVVDSVALTNANAKAKVQIAKSPDFARIIRIEPEEVEFLVIKP